MYVRLFKSNWSVIRLDQSQFKYNHHFSVRVFLIIIILNVDENWNPGGFQHDTLWKSGMKLPVY